jgi:hypothetical protein
MIEATAYKCEYCDKIYKLKPSCKRHELTCFANPGMRACRTCKNVVGDEEERTMKCNITKKFLSHPWEICKFEHGCKYYREGEKIF